MWPLSWTVAPPPKQLKKIKTSRPLNFSNKSDVQLCSHWTQSSSHIPSYSRPYGGGGEVSVLLYTVCTYVHVHCPTCVWGGGESAMYMCVIWQRDNRSTLLCKKSQLRICQILICATVVHIGIRLAYFKVYHEIYVNSYVDAMKISMYISLLWKSSRTLSCFYIE